MAQRTSALWGSLIGDKVGGHNVLEPAALGVPIINGPSFFNFKEIVHEMKQNNLIKIVKNEDELARAIVALIKDVAVHEHITSELAHFMLANSGSLQRTTTATSSI